MVDHKKNNDIRVAAFSRGVRLWEIAEKMGLSESGLSRRLRHELDDKQRAEILNVIDGIATHRR